MGVAPPAGVAVAELLLSFLLGVGWLQAFCLFYFYSNIPPFTLIIFPGIPPLNNPIRLNHKHSDLNLRHLVPS